MSIASLNCDSISVIFNFLHFKDAIKICFMNKFCYIKFIIFCYKYSFVPLNLNKKKHELLKFIDVGSLSNSDNLSNGGVSFDLFQIFCKEVTDIKNIQHIDIINQIRNANCINNVPCLEKISKFIPKKLKYISFNKNFNAPWDKKILPDTVETITFHEKCKFNFNITSINLPLKLRKISFGYMFDKCIDDLPDTIEIIYFCHNSRFNKIIKKYPLNLKELYLGNNYNKPLLNMIDSIKVIYFSNNSVFNSEIQYPSQLEKIYFGKQYNRSLLPLAELSNLSIIKFHYNSVFNLPIDCEFISLKAIYFGIEFNNDLNLCKCNSLTTIRFYTKSKFNRDFTKIPGSLEYLYMGKNFDSILSVPNTIKLVKFSQNSKFVKQVDFFDTENCAFEKDLSKKNSSKKELVMGKRYKDYYKL